MVLIIDAVIISYSWVANISLHAIAFSGNHSKNPQYLIFRTLLWHFSGTFKDAICYVSHHFVLNFFEKQESVPTNKKSWSFGEDNISQKQHISCVI